jgi:hypothetical protein
MILPIKERDSQWVKLQNMLRKIDFVLNSAARKAILKKSDSPHTQLGYHFSYVQMSTNQIAEKAIAT